jgi:hypothetical protein
MAGKGVSIEPGMLDALLRDWAECRQAPGANEKAFLERYVTPEEATEIRETTECIHAQHEALRQSGLTPTAFVAKEFATLMQDKAGGTMGIDMLPGIGMDESPEAAARLVMTAALATPVAMEHTPLEGVIPREPDKVTIEFLNEEMGSENERQFTRVVSAATVKHLRDAGVVDAPRAAVVTAVVGSGVATAKVGYRVAIGKMSKADGVEYLAERAAATVSALTRKFAPDLISRGGEALGMFLGSLVGNPVLGGQIGAQVGRLAGERFAKPIGEAVGSVAKAVVQTVATGLKKAAGFITSLFA